MYTFLFIAFVLFVVGLFAVAIVMSKANEVHNEKALKVVKAKARVRDWSHLEQYADDLARENADVGASIRCARLERRHAAALHMVNQF